MRILTSGKALKNIEADSCLRCHSSFLVSSLQLHSSSGISATFHCSLRLAYHFVPISGACGLQRRLITGLRRLNCCFDSHTLPPQFSSAPGGKRMRKIVFLLAFAVAAMAAVPRIQGQQRGTGLSQEVAAKRVATEKELESVALIERKRLVPMRDGKRMAADVYRPKDASKKYPVIFVRTPYNFNYWDVRNGVPRDMSAELDAVKRGYAYVEMNERGHFFSEGEYDILGPPRTDGFDALA